MSATSQRVFADNPAVRGPSPLLLGIAGPSSSGKTYSALRLATGMQRVIGGDIRFIDTERNRALHYAERFKFRHVPLDAPYSPLDYLAAIKHCIAQGSRIIVVDSMSHEHEGPGGVLDWHDAEIERLKKAWRTDSDEKVNIPAWGRPKAGRRELLNFIAQANVNFVFCFRAKNKISISRKKGEKSEVVQLGFMPIAADEFVYELTAKCLLMPGAGGVPTLESEEVGEKMMIKLPEQFRTIFAGAAGKPIDEDLGEQLAKWAAGSTQQATTSTAVTYPSLDEYAACRDAATLELLEKRRAEHWKKVPTPLKPQLKDAYDAAAERIRAAKPEPLTLSGAPVDTEAGAIAVLEAAYKNGRDAVRAEMTRIESDYAARGQPIPLAVDAKYGELNEALKE